MKYPSMVVMLFLLGGCAFNFEVTSQRTALENQVMGTYKELDDELVLSGAVRGSNARGNASNPALAARQNQMFNEDEIFELKGAGLLGEGIDGYLKKINQRSADAGVPKFLLDSIDVLTQQENADRQTIWRQMIEQNKNLTSSDLPNIGRSYAKIMREKTPAGHWYQDEDGKWVQRQ